MTAAPKLELSLLEAAERLGVGRIRAHQLVSTGKLAAEKRGNKYVVQLADVEKLNESRKPGPAKKGPGAPVLRTEAGIALQAFDLFAASASLRTVMAALDLTPVRVRALFKEWQTPLGGKHAEDVEADRDRDHAAWVKEFEETQRTKRELADRDHARRMKELDK